jgi:hypothetical protein
MPRHLTRDTRASLARALKGGPSALVLLARAHPDIFEDAL